MRELTSVSAVIPTFGRPDQCVAAVRSALNQTVPPSEVLVVIDGAEPQTRVLVERESPIVRVIELGAPGGQGGATARNAGVEAATGDFVAFLDDDDEWMPDKLQKQSTLLISLAEGERERVVCSSRALWQSEYEQRVLPRRLITPGERVGEYLFVPRRDGRGQLATPTLLVSRGLALAVPFAAGMRQYDDYDWVLRLEEHGAKFVHHEEALTTVHAPLARSSLSQTGRWQDSLEWAETKRSALGRCAFLGFCLGNVSAVATRERAWPAFFRLTLLAVRGGAPPGMLVRFLMSWFLTPSWKARVRRVAGSRVRGVPRIF